MANDWQAKRDEVRGIAAPNFETICISALCSAFKDYGCGCGWCHDCGHPEGEHNTHAASPGPAMPSGAEEVPRSCQQCGVAITPYLGDPANGWVDSKGSLMGMHRHHASQPAPAPDAWISVSERMPSEFDEAGMAYVLGYHDGMITVRALRKAEDDGALYWIAYSAKADPTHWMPLPAPPSAGKGDRRG